MMPLPLLLKGRLDIPVIGAPMLVPCHPPLTIAQCTNGIVGAFPALSARPKEQLEEWICALKVELARFQKAHPDRRVAPFAINQIVHKSNDRLDHDMEICVKHQVPIIITSLGANADLVKTVHAYGGIVLHDVLSTRHAEKALTQGVDGLILLCAGGGGHGGTLNPFAFVAEVRRFFQGPLAVSGTITSGKAVAAIQMMGADLAYIGTRFLATHESRATDDWKDLILKSEAKDILYSPWFNGVHASWLKPSIATMGLDPEDPKLLLRNESKNDAKFNVSEEGSKSWKAVRTAGQGVGNIDSIDSAATVIARLKAEYAEALDAFTRRQRD
jgi:nitronate monooxygenase